MSLGKIFKNGLATSSIKYVIYPDIKFFELHITRSFSPVKVTVFNLNPKLYLKLYFSAMSVRFFSLKYQRCGE